MAEAGLADKAEVYLLQGGFHKWLNAFWGSDEEATLIEGLDRDLWVQHDGSWVYAPDVPFDFGTAENAPLQGDEAAEASTSGA